MELMPDCRRVRYRGCLGKQGAANLMASERKGGIPLYHQIFLVLRDEILSGQRPYDSPMPTEFEVGEQFGVSRITARRALDELALEGLVERRRRTGTRVIYRAPAKPIEADIDQAVESLIAFGRNTSVQVLEVARETADPSIAARLELPEGAKVVRAVRLRNFDGAPLGEITSWLPERFAKLADRRTLTNTPMLELLRGAGVKIGGAQQTIEARVADPSLAERLSIEPLAPVLRVERLVEDADNRPVLLTVANYRADRYRISLDMHAGSRISADIH